MPSCFRSQPFRSLLLVACLALMSLPTWAEKPQWVGGGNSDKQHKQKHDRDERRDHRRDDRQDDRRDDARPVARQASGGLLIDIQIGGYFRDPQRISVRDYYGAQIKQGKCPPGLRKKNNGCQPPGQAKAWRRGAALPSAVVYYPLPAAVQVRLGVPPAGHKYVRVASDILLIAIGTSLVVDAIEDLGGL